MGSAGEGSRLDTTEGLEAVIQAIIALFCGESLAIYGEMLATKSRFTWAVLCGVIGQLSLLYGYWIGYKATGHVWSVTVASIGSIVIVEPILIWITLHEPPTRNALIGWLFGVAGIVIANLK